MSLKRAFSVWYNDKTGEMTDLKMAPEFDAENPLFRADVMAEAAEVVEEFYENSLVNMEQYFESIKRSNRIE